MRVRYTLTFTLNLPKDAPFFTGDPNDLITFGVQGVWLSWLKKSENNNIYLEKGAHMIMTFLGKRRTAAKKRKRK